MNNSESKRFSLRVIKSAEPEEILEILKELGNHELRVLSRRTNLRLNNSKFKTIELANLFKLQLYVGMPNLTAEFSLIWPAEKYSCSVEKFLRTPLMIQPKNNL